MFFIYIDSIYIERESARETNKSTAAKLYYAKTC